MKSEQILINQFLLDKKSGGNAYQEMVYKALNEEITSNYELEKIIVNPNYFSKLIPFQKVRLYGQLLTKKSKADINIFNYQTLLTYPYSLDDSFDILIFHHDYTQNIGSSIKSKFLKKIFFNWKLGQVDQIVCGSHYWANFIKDFTDKNISVIRNSFKVKEIRNIVSDFDRDQYLEQLGIDPEKTIIYGGMAIKPKGFDFLLKALAGNEKFEIISTGQKELEGDFRHFSLDYSDYLKLISSCDVAVLLSRMQEGWNRIAHECLLAGTPVIGHGTGGYKELLSLTDQNQLKIKNRNHFKKQLIRKIEKVKNNYQKYSQKGSKELSKFDVNYFSNQWSSLLDKCIEKIK